MDAPLDSRKLDVLARRLDVLQRLAEGPAHKRDLIDELEHSRSTINRAVSELEDVDLVERDDDGFAATVAGRLALERHETFRREIDDIVDADPVVGPLPADAPIDVEALTGSDASVASEPAPYRPLERFHDRIADARRYRALLPALDDPRHVRLLYEHVVTNDRPAELIVTRELFDALRTEFPRRMAAMADSDGFSVLVGDAPAFAVGRVDVGTAADPSPSVSVVVFNEQGGVHGVLQNRTPGAVRWAADLYGDVRAGAEDRTDALRADADGGTTRTGTEGAVTRPPRGDSLSVALEREGFVGVDASFFRDEPVADPRTAWRSGLTLPEVHTGYAIERRRPAGAADDGDRPGDAEELSASLGSTLAGGGNCLLVGPPGSGKSTTCKQVACEWYRSDRGSVVYRAGDRGRPFEAVDDLALAVDVADGHALVVVEDAVRPDAVAVFDAIDRLGDRDDVSFMLDARESEWRDPPGDPTDVSDLEVRHMPPLGDQDHERLVEQFERTVGETVDVPLGQLREEVRGEAAHGDDAAPNEVLLLLHRLATYADPLADGRTSLEEAVATLHDDIAAADLALDVCVLANALNAAGLGVDAGALYAVAEPGEFDAVDGALDLLEGRVLFPREDGSYRTVHESWSVAFLAHLLEAEGEAAAAERFGRSTSALLSLADAPGLRESIAHHRGGRWTLAAVEDDPTAWADEAVEAIYALGRERPKLTPLFGDGDRDSVDLPASCSEGVADERPAAVGWMSVACGDYDRAERAFERLPRADADCAPERLLGLAHVATERGEYDDAVVHAEECLELVEDAERPVDRARAELEVGRAQAGRSDYGAARSNLTEALTRFEAVDERRRMSTVLDELGKIARDQSAYDDAREYHRRSLSLSRELGDRQGVADSLRNLGSVSYARGEYDRAREYYERGLDISRELGDRDGEANCFNVLGTVASTTGDHDQAMEYRERSLAIFRELGDRDGVATLLGNIGVAAERVGDYDRAHEYLEESLDTTRTLGDRYGEATRLNNLGLVAVRLGDHDQAREYFQRGLAIARECGTGRREANSLNGLGHVARMRGRYDRAREYHEEALELTRSVGFPRREADSLNKLGRIAAHLGDRDRAREHFERGGAVARDIGQPREETRSLRGLGELAREAGEHDRARDAFEQALERIESAGDRIETAQVRLSVGRLALAGGDVDRGREQAGRANEEFEAMGATHWQGRSQRLLGRVAAEDGDDEAAQDHWRAALGTFVDVGAPQDALATLERLVEHCREADDVEGADRWCERAEDVLEGAPDPVADEHREWVGRQRSALGGE